MKATPKISPKVTAADRPGGIQRQRDSPAVALAAPTSRPHPRQLRHLQGAVGNVAVSRLVAQRYAEVVKPPPDQAPGFRQVTSDIETKKATVSQHPPATGEAKAAQDAAVAPSDDKEAQGKTAKVGKMDAAEAGVFDKAAFIDAVNQAIDSQAPKNLDEADKFSESGKADRVKEQVDGKVVDGKKSSAEEIEAETKADPDTSQATDKEVTPMTSDQPPGVPGAPSADSAIPDKQPDEVLDFSEGKQQTDQQLAEAEVTEEQLAKGNEPEFDQALAEKKHGEEESAKAPSQGRAAEGERLAGAKAGAAAAGAQAMASMAASRDSAGQDVDSGKGATKTADEKKREQVTGKLQKVFDATQKDVEKILSGLDETVDDQFGKGEKKARDAFTADHERRMKAYKDKRYSGLTGKGRWLKDKFAGLPEEANDLYQESRKLYVRQMQGVISSIADTIGRELGKAKTRIATGRNELEAEVEKLPTDLRKFGDEAAADFADKFDELESDVNDKSDQLVQDLAQKYTEALNAVDEEIEKLREANRGLWDKVKDAVAGAIQTIMELKDLLLGILAKAAGAVAKILGDPIGFLRNLVSAVGSGLDRFTDNIEQHLKTGLVSWLLGTSVKAGIQIPSKFDVKGIIQLIGAMLGLTWDAIRGRIIRKGVPEKAMTKVEQSVPAAQALQREGPSGVAKGITAETGNLKKSVLDRLKSYLIPTVLIAGITWIISLLNPASAFVRAVKAIVDIVKFIITQGAQVIEFVNAVLDSVVAIASGGSAEVPKLIETSLAASIPLLIGFLAALLGIGGLASKVKSVFQAVGRPVKRAVGKVIDKISRAGKRLWNRAKRKQGRCEKPSDDARKVDKGLAQIDREQKAVSVSAAISQEDAKEIASKVKLAHPVFKSITVVDGSKTWDYRYVASPPRVHAGAAQIENKTAKEAHDEVIGAMSTKDKGLLKGHGEWVPGHAGRNFKTAMHNNLDDIGYVTFDHSDPSITDPGTKPKPNRSWGKKGKGSWIPDHQPPDALGRGGADIEFRFYPHSLISANEQKYVVIQYKSKMKKARNRDNSNWAEGVSSDWFW